jgi:carbohydrate-selective porin OprB
MRINGKRLCAQTFAFVAALLIGSACEFGPAWAQAQRSDEPKEPSPPYLSGDWGGLRPYLERKGLTFTLSYTNDFLANVRGGIGPGAV